jgi:hypothetical protein
MSKKDDELCGGRRGGYTPDMDQARGDGSPRLGRADLARILSPLLFFVAHVVYLALWSREPFFNRWIDGSFSFFLALVLCNIIRARIVGDAARRGDHPGGGAEDEGDEPREDPPPG